MSKKIIGAKTAEKKIAAKARKQKAVEIAKEINANKRYDIIAAVPTILAKDVTRVIEENKLKTALKHDSYFIITNVGEDEVKNIKKMFEPCLVSTHNGRRVLKISFTTMKSKVKEVNTEPRKRKVSNNTTEAKTAAKKARKTRNKAVAAARTEYAKNRNASKKRVLVGRKAKLYYMVDGENGTAVMTRVNRKRGFQGDNLQNHRRKAANKAGQYLLKQEAKQTAKTQKKAEIKPIEKPKKKPTVVQTEMALAA